MHKPIVWSDLAVQDFEFILEYLSEKWNDKVVVQFIDLTFHLIEQITINPKQFPVIKKKGNIRKCVLTKHNTLFYREGLNKIEILRIFDTRQNLKTLKFK